MERKRFRVRPAGNDDPDCEFDIEAYSPTDAVRCVAEIVGNDTGHRRLLVEVMIAGVWTVYDCRPKKVTTTVYEVVP